MAISQRVFLMRNKRVLLAASFPALPGISAAAFDFLPSYRSERGSTFIGQSIRDKSFVPYGSGRLPCSTIEERAGVGTSISGNAPDFQCQAVIQMRITGAANNGDAAHSTDARVNQLNPARNTRRRPQWSLSEPAGRISEARVSV